MHVCYRSNWCCDCSRLHDITTTFRRLFREQLHEQITLQTSSSLLAAISVIQKMVKMWQTDVKIQTDSTKYCRSVWRFSCLQTDSHTGRTQITQLQLLPASQSSSSICSCSFNLLRSSACRNRISTRLSKSMPLPLPQPLPLGLSDAPADTRYTTEHNTLIEIKWTTYKRENVSTQVTPRRLNSRRNPRRRP